MEKPRATGDHPGEMNNNNGECGWRPCCPDVFVKLMKVKGVKRRLDTSVLSGCLGTVCFAPKG